MRVLTDEAGGRSVGALAYFPDGHRLAVVGTPKGAEKLRTHVARLEVWNLVTRTVDVDRRLSSGHGRCVAVSPDGKTIAAGEGNWDIRVCKAANGESTGYLCSPRGTAVALAFSPNGEHLVSGSADRGALTQMGSLTLWRRPQYTQEFSPPRTAGYAVCYPADGRFLAYADGEGAVVFMSSFEDTDPERHPTGGLIRALALSRDGHHFAAAVGGKIRVCDRRDGEPQWIGRQRKPYNSVAFSPDGSTLMTGGSDGVIRLWDVGTWQERAAFEWGFANVQCVAFSPDGLTCAAGGRGEVSLVIWDVE